MTILVNKPHPNSNNSIDLFFSVDSQPLGKMMYEKHVTPAIMVCINDSLKKKMLKSLAATMLSKNPKDRPCIDDVLVELKNIAS